MNEEAPRVRFAPSPTGPFHVGSARTALFNWLFARKHNGKFILRIEDTDTERSEKQYEEQIFEALRWLKLEWDEGPDKGGDFGPYRQRERLSIYKEYLEKLLSEGRAFYCYCTKEELEAQKNAMMAEGLPTKYGGHCRNLKEAPAGKSPQAIRFKMPDVEVEFKDIIRGNVKFDAALIGDIVIAKNLDTPLYNFAVVVDDHLMKISHVIRGEDHLSNTPKQILMARAMGFVEPHFAHLPLILSADKRKLSKRDTEVSLLTYREEGCLPEAVDNFLALLGWHPSHDKEVFSLEELVQEFELKRVQKSGAVFNEEKLLWLNGEHLKRLPSETLADLVKDLIPETGNDPEFLLRVVNAVRERMKTLSDFKEHASFFFRSEEYDSKLLMWQNDSGDKTKEILSRASQKIKELPDELSKEMLLNAMEDLMIEYGRGSVLWPLRVAVSGRPASPDPLDIIIVLGKKETLARIDSALKKIDALSI